MSRSGLGPAPAPESDRQTRPRRTSTTRTFFYPSPSASSTARHRQSAPSSSSNPNSNVNSHYHLRVPSSHSSQEPNPGSLHHISESDSENEEGDEMREMSKLELRRAKNRLKQRNLRHRRATHVSQLEESVRSLKRDVASLREHATLQTTVITSNESKYRSWLSDLEAVLFRQGHGQEVENSRQAWERSIQAIPVWTSPAPPKPGKGGRKSAKVTVKQEPRDTKHMTSQLPDSLDTISHRDSQVPIDVSARRGSLSTLVQAAMASDSTQNSPSFAVGHPSSSSVDVRSHSTHHHHQHSPYHNPRYHTYPPPQSGPRYSDQSRAQSRTGPIQPQSHDQHANHPKGLTVYPGSLQALSNPPSLPRQHYRARTIPSSSSGGTSTSAPTAPNTSLSFNTITCPEDPADRKRKRSLSGPTLHSSRTSTGLPPILPMSLSAPNSGMIQTPSIFSDPVPPLPLGPPPLSLFGSIPRSRPSSSHQPILPRPSSSIQTQSTVPMPASSITPSGSGSGWHTLAPFRPQTAPTSRPATPASTLIDTPTPRTEASPQYMSIANLISPTEGQHR